MFIQIFFNSLQTHSSTRTAQLRYWSEVLKDYFLEKKVNETSLSELEENELFFDRSSGIISFLYKKKPYLNKLIISFFVKKNLVGKI